MSDVLQSAPAGGADPLRSTAEPTSLYDRSFRTRPEPLYDRTPLHAVDPPFVAVAEPYHGERGQRVAWSPPVKRGTKPGKRFAGNSDTEIGEIARPDPRRSVLCRARPKCGRPTVRPAAMKVTTCFVLIAFEPTIHDEDAGRWPHPDHTS